jgi:lipopolysaccharide biosynthesis glycosyltransferase
MVIVDDIYNLWKLNITDYFLAAVREGQFNRYDQLKIPHGSDYFNSGVMLINLIKWREYNISQIAKQFLSEHSENLKYHDQEGFNAALYKYPWIKLPPKWNQLSSMFRWSFSEMRFDEAEYQEALVSPSIIHYSGDSKPWHYLHSGDMRNRPFKDEYLHYLQYTPWCNDVYPEKALFDRKIIVFGTGSLSQQLSEQLREKGHRIAYYIDNSTDKVGTSFLGLPVNSPAQLLVENKDEIVILIASAAFNEIATQLVRMGFKAGAHFIGGKGIRKYH